jgi:predicted TIM-barrel fold metal-dependent hydrolase
VKGIQLLGELGLSFDFCVRPMELPDFDKLVSQCPGTRFILDHCGNPNRNFKPSETEKWKKGLALLAARKNVMCKVSGLVANGFDKGEWKADDLAPFVNATLDAFGPDRVMFGGDWPVCLVAGSYKDWLTALRQIVSPRPEAEQRKLFHDNAVKFYSLA